MLNVGNNVYLNQLQCHAIYTNINVTMIGTWNLKSTEDYKLFWKCSRCSTFFHGEFIILKLVFSRGKKSINQNLNEFYTCLRDERNCISFLQCDVIFQLQYIYPCPEWVRFSTLLQAVCNTFCLVPGYVWYGVLWR